MYPPIWSVACWAVKQTSRAGIIMSIELLNAVWEERSLKPNLKFVLLCLADYSGKEGKCWPSISTLCLRTGLSRTTVKSALKTLEADGWISKTNRFARDGVSRRKTSNLYQLNKPKLSENKHEKASDNRSSIDLTVGCGTPHDRAVDDHKPQTKPTSRTINLQSEDEQKLVFAVEKAFECFWNAGLLKRGKKKAFSRFKAYVNAKGLSINDIHVFGQMLATDIHCRFEKRQFGIERLHPTTYLAQERWEDEHESDQQRTNSSSDGKTKLSSQDRFMLNQLNKYGERTLLETGFVSKADVERLSTYLEVRRGSASRVVEGDFIVLNA